MKHGETINIPDTYFSLLENLSIENKLELISKLADSIKLGKRQFEKSSIGSLFGAFESDKTAEEMIDDLRNSRLFNRKIEEF